MGFQIPGPTKGKVQYLVDVHQAVVLYGSPEISGHECLLSRAAIAGSSYGADAAGAQPTAQSERIKA
jgi:hypothetical protein